MTGRQGKKTKKSLQSDSIGDYKQQNGSNNFEKNAKSVEKSQIELLNEKVKFLEKKLDKKRTIISFLMKRLAKNKKSNKKNVLDSSESDEKESFDVFKPEKRSPEFTSQNGKSFDVAPELIHTVNKELKQNLKKVSTPVVSDFTMKSEMFDKSGSFTAQNEKRSTPTENLDLILADVEKLHLTKPIENIATTPDQFDFLRNNFNPKPTANPPFKINAKLDEFFDFVSNTYVPFVHDRESSLHRLLVTYVKNNTDGIIKQIFHDFIVNEIDGTEKIPMKLSESAIKLVFSLFYMLGQALPLKNCLILVQDLFVFCSDFELVFFWSYAVLRKHKFPNTFSTFNTSQSLSGQKILSDTLRLLLSYQGTIMLHQNKSALTSKILIDLNLKDEFDLKPILTSLLEANSGDFPEKLSALRCVTSFMDWNWTFNYFIIRVLIPRLVALFENEAEYLSQKAPQEQYNPIRQSKYDQISIFVAYIGVLMDLGHRQIGPHKSVSVLCDLLKKILDGNVKLSDFNSGEDKNNEKQENIGKTNNLITVPWGIRLVAARYLKAYDFHHVEKWTNQNVAEENVLMNLIDKF